MGALRDEGLAPDPVMDGYSRARLAGAAIDYDPEKETEGTFLDHDETAFAAFR